MMKIFNHTYYYLDYNAEKNILSFYWTEAHGQMTFEDFTEACSNYAGYAFQYQCNRLLVDTSNFAFKMPEEYSEWSAKHQARLIQLKGLKMAYMMPPDSMAYVNNQEADNNNFATNYYTTEEEAINWLTAE